MSRINSNIPALRAIHQLALNQTDLNIRLNRLATGLRINRGADDPAGLIASERLRSETRTIQQAIENSGRAANVISVAEGSLNQASALLLDLQSLVVQAANEGGMSEDEISANQLQIDSILSSLDRIADTTSFAGKKLLDGSLAYLTSGMVPAAFPSVQIFSARMPQGGSRQVRVEVTGSAQTAQINFVGMNVSGTSTTSATTIALRGTLGSEILSFASGTSLAQIRSAINNVTAVTGVEAVVSAAAVGTAASALMLSSIEVGADAFVSVGAIGGNFIEAGNADTSTRTVGVDATVLVDGQPAVTKGLRAEVRTSGLDARFFLTQAFAQTLSSASFNIIGGGAVFQLTPEVTPNGQTHVGLTSIATSQLGNAVSGLLFTVRSGGSNDLASHNFLTAQKVIKDAISQISFIRGRLGNIQKNIIEPNVAAQSVALENVTAAESIIRDADMAAEVSALTRAQILVQSTQTTLQIANSQPTAVLSLLG